MVKGTYFLFVVYLFVFFFKNMFFMLPLWFLCKSHFSPIPRNGFTTDLKRTWNGGRANDEESDDLKEIIWVRRM